MNPLLGIQINTHIIRHYVIEYCFIINSKLPNYIMTNSCVYIFVYQNYIYIILLNSNIYTLTTSILHRRNTATF